MKQRTLEEEWEYYKRLEQENINPFEYAGEPCKDCTNCISVCGKRKGTDITITEDLKKYIDSETLKSTNIQIDEKCACCPYMFEYKCQRSSCMFDDCDGETIK